MDFDVIASGMLQIDVDVIALGRIAIDSVVKYQRNCDGFHLLCFVP